MAEEAPEVRQVGIFYESLMQMLLQAVYSGYEPDGAPRYGPPAPGPDGVRHFVVPESAMEDGARFKAWAALLPRFARAFRMLADDASRQVLIHLLAYYILEGERVILPITPGAYGKAMAELAPLLQRERTHEVNFEGIKLDLYDLRPANIPMSVHTTRSALLAHYFLKQYELRHGHTVVTVEPGDTVIEGGMCYGDTALLFAHMAGPKGQVWGYEFEPNNLKILADNLGINPMLAKRIHVLRHAVSDTSGQSLNFVMAGPATCTVPDGAVVDRPLVRVETLCIDDLVEREKLPRVNFIKLDVEGMELPTLRGAVETLKRFRPKLALSAYHKADDIPVLLDYVASLDLGYSFWLEHFRPHRQETVLFAKSGRK